jgi:hypothetical protein
MRRAAACAILLAVLAACGHKNGLVPTVPPSATLEQYAQIINAQAAINHVPPELVGAIVAVESGGNARATNPSGAMGLMQLKPATAARYGVTDLYNPTANITAGTRYLHDLLTRFHGNITLAVAAFQAGPSNQAPLGDCVHVSWCFSKSSSLPGPCRGLLLLTPENQSCASTDSVAPWGVTLFDVTF